MPRTEESNRQIRDERMKQIYNAAAKVFARNGYVGTRIDDIASEASISKGLIYHYFGSKDAIFNALVERASVGTVRLYEHALDRPGTAAQRLRWLIEEIVVSLGAEDHASVFMVVMQAFVSDAVPQESRAEVSMLGKKSGAIMTQLIKDGQTNGEIISGDPEHLALLIGSSIQGLAVTHVMNTPIPSQEIAETLSQLIAPTS